VGQPDIIIVGLHRQQSVTQRQAEYHNLVAEKNVLDDLKRALDEQHLLLVGQKRVLDQNAALPGGIGADQYQEALATYNRDLASYNHKLAEYTSRVESLNNRVANFNK